MHLRASVLAFSSVVFFACAPPLEDEPLTENESELAADAGGPVWHPSGKAVGADGGAVEDIGSELVALIGWFDGGIVSNTDAGAGLVTDSGVSNDSGGAEVPAAPKPACFDEAAGFPAWKHVGACSAGQVRELGYECDAGLDRCRAAAKGAGACGACVMDGVDGTSGFPRGPFVMKNGAFSRNESACKHLAAGTATWSDEDYLTCQRATCSSCGASDRSACELHASESCLRNVPQPPPAEKHLWCYSGSGVVDALCGSGDGSDTFVQTAAAWLPENVGTSKNVTVSWECSTHTVVAQLGAVSSACGTPTNQTRGACKSWAERGTCSGAVTMPTKFTANLAIDATTCLDQHDNYTKCLEPFVYDENGVKCVAATPGTYCNGTPSAGFTGKFFADMFNATQENLGDVSMYNRLMAHPFGEMTVGWTADQEGRTRFYSGGNCSASPDRLSYATAFRYESQNSFEIRFIRQGVETTLLYPPGASAAGTCRLVVTAK